MARTRIWKDGLLRGTWVTTKGQVFNCTDADLDYFKGRTKAMMANGFKPPWTFEHQQDNDTDPTKLSSSDYLARWSKNTGGHIEDVRIATDGSALEFLMDIDEADIPTLESIKFVSPDLRTNWRDTYGPEMDEHGPFWPGMSIAHVAVTPIPVQYPQKPFNFDVSAAMSLSQASVSVSLSSAIFQLSAGPKGKDMPFPPPKDDDDTGADDAMDDMDDAAPKLDIETPKPPTPPTDPAGGMNDDARRIQTLSEIIKPLGIDVHVTSGMTLGQYVDHLHTAFKTHQATKGPDADPSMPPPPDNNQIPQEPELPENNAPIMMSAAQTDKLKAVILKQSTKELANRIGVLYKAGYIDDTIRKKLANEVGAVQLSSVSNDGELLPNSVLTRIEAYEDLMNAGVNRPGPFAKPKAATPARVNPAKPISSALALSAGDDEKPEQGIINPHDATTMAKQEEAGAALASLAGCRIK